MTIVLRKPYLLFLGDVQLPSDAKTAFGLRDWCGTDVRGQWSLPQAQVDLGLPRLTFAAAAARGCQSLVIGVAPTGGQLPEHWLNALEEALHAGLDLVSGLHTKLTALPRLVEAAQRSGRRLVDVRDPGTSQVVGTGRKRSGLRLLTVGTDCALGKKYTALALTEALRAARRAASFRATGQTGIMITGAGVPIDAVVCDFLAGAAEALTPDNAPEHWDVVEGQGSLFHPAYAAVTLGLLHGSQPDAIVLCHDPRRQTIEGYPDYPIPDLGDAINVYLQAGRLTNARIRCIGLSINSSGLSDVQWEQYRSETSQRLQLPVCDPMRGGVGLLVDRLLQLEAEMP